MSLRLTEREIELLCFLLDQEMERIEEMIKRNPDNNTLVIGNTMRLWAVKSLGEKLRQANDDDDNNNPTKRK